MIIITGALGFIGSCLVRKLNDEGHQRQLMVVDDFYKDYKEKNLDNKQIREWVHRSIFLEIFKKMSSQIEFVFHLGARTDTTEQDVQIMNELNLWYSQAIWEHCAEVGIPLIYASSAATYGNGQWGYEDNHEVVARLKPLNAYGRSKNDFDRWALAQKKQPPFWAGLKFFNVYGPNESHKKRMASVVFHATQQIQQTGQLALFKSHKKGIAHGEQKRDFVYVKDIVDVCYFLYQQQPESGLYNVGTGEARTFLDLAHGVFQALDREPNIRFIDTPKDIRKTYQYFTQANIGKLRAAGYTTPFQQLETGIADYVRNYLLPRKIW
ncbi:MAG: ADP-glyceromanno-heptose 6-epimerase [Bacteroidota bacterium]